MDLASAFVLAFEEALTAGHVTDWKAINNKLAHSGMNRFTTQMENTKRQNLLEELRIAEFTSADIASDALKRVEKADNSEATTLNISEEAARRAELDGAA